MDAHLRYLERDGVNRDGEKGQVYSAERDVEDGRTFLDRGRDDRHQFRFIVSAEEGVEPEKRARGASGAQPTLPAFGCRFRRSSVAGANSRGSTVKGKPAGATCATWRSSPTCCTCSRE